MADLSGNSLCNTYKKEEKYKGTFAKEGSMAIFQIASHQKVTQYSKEKYY